MRAVDSRDIGVATHALKALGEFHRTLTGAHQHLSEGWRVYEPEARKLLDAAHAAAMFLSPEMSEAVAPFIDAYVATGEKLPERHEDLYGQSEAVRFIAKRLVTALLGELQTKEKS